MSIYYSLRFRKISRQGKILVEKEGEIILSQKYFTLKGKGAKDKGENWLFTQIKSIDAREKEQLVTMFSYNGDRLQLFNIGTAFNDFVKDLFKIRNQFFADNLNIKSGILLGRYEAALETKDPLGNFYSKDNVKIELYERSIVFIPEMHDVFSINLNFLKSHRFNDQEFALELELEDGKKLMLHKFTSQAEEFEQHLERELSKMYEFVMNNLLKLFPELSVQNLLKLSHKIRLGRFVSIQELRKIDPNLPDRFIHTIFSDNNDLKSKFQYLRSLDREEIFAFSINFQKSENDFELNYRTFAICILPNKNLMAISPTFSTSKTTESSPMAFFRVSPDPLQSHEKAKQRQTEFSQALIHIDFDYTILFKSKFDLAKNKFRTSIHRLNFLRLLRKCSLGLISLTQPLDSFIKEVERLLYYSFQKKLKIPTPTQIIPKFQPKQTKPALSPKN